MEYRRLGRSDLEVSRICLGTMTWGEQNTEAQAHEQMDYARERNINFFDAAEMYPVPPKPETYGRTEQYIGTWFAKTGRRQEVILATKALGPSARKDIRGGPRLSREQIKQAAEASLKRLQTDYIDLYQLHWPERSVNSFGKLGYTVVSDEDVISIEETLRACDELVREGKVRRIGVSNETAWGVSEYLRLSREEGLVRIDSIQNPYSLLNRSFEVGLAEMAYREDVGLLAYSPLAMGRLSGKYSGGARPEGARLTLFDRFQRYNTPNGIAAADEYVQVARDHGLDPAQMALSYINDRPFVTANIIGATNLEQLKSNIDSHSLTLSAEVLADIEAVHQRYPYPCP
ncbi:NADP(H)-dependent aldo-keto reductase [Saccharospirillum mangrovi]|uniref:NADP(H)-dependent aldo-keto reductase n=1 Tax=Saccharospirillum mangrovi TaxID=2161747 RepID=UPI000D3A2F84|nr:NADP(H)-dependent aldo-keto reductase [Saccharospirillum mangrovi]